MWGGLRPIPSRFFLDVTTLSALTYCVVTNPHVMSNSVVLLGAYALTGITAGFTWRWTISFPMAPLLLLQIFRRLSFVQEGSAMPLVILVFSLLLLALAAALTVLFPAVDLSPIEGKFNVGVVDIHLPVHFNVDGCHKKLEGKKGFVKARLLYPTHEEKGWIPYFHEDIADELCAELIKVGAPPPLKNLYWMLRTWRLTHIPAKRNAQPIDGLLPRDVSVPLETMHPMSNKMPLAVFSHGITGNANIYSYQTLNLAADGTVVLSIEHSDGSSIGIKRRDGSFMSFDTSIGKKESYEDQVRDRRAQTDHRISEVLSSAVVLCSLNERNVPELDKVGISFVGKLNTKDLTVMGHSFGGGTALASAARRPDLLSCVVAHEPTPDWMPDDCRRALFPEAKFKNCDKRYEGGTNGYETTEDDTKQHEEKKDEAAEKSLHDIDMLFLYSEEWYSKGWGSSLLLKDMHSRGELGPGGGVSNVGEIVGSAHSAFSDSCMMTPLWIARGTGFTGQANPHDSAIEIAARTLEFIKAVREKNAKQLQRE